MHRHSLIYTCYIGLYHCPQVILAVRLLERYLTSMGESCCSILLGWSMDRVWLARQPAFCWRGPHMIAHSECGVHQPRAWLLPKSEYATSLPADPVKLPQAKAKKAHKPCEKTYKNWWAPVTIMYTNNRRGGHCAFTSVYVVI